MTVAHSPFAPPRYDNAISVVKELPDLLRTVPAEYSCAARDGYNEVMPVVSVLLLAPAVFAAFCALLGLVEETDKRVGVEICLEDDTAAVSAVTTVGAAPGNELLTTEAGTTVAATPGSHVYRDSVNEGAGLHGI